MDLSKVFCVLVPATRGHVAPRSKQKVALKNHVFTMKKCHKFGHGFESQTFQVNCDPLSYFNVLITHRGICMYLKVSLEVKKLGK